nr:MAG TPA: hypothetical protein [Caudoviricetes sp.]
MQEVKVQKRNGFTMNIEEVPLFFATSQENIERLLSLEDNVDGFIGELKSKYGKKAEEFDNKLKNSEEVDREAFSGRLNLMQEVTREAFDYIYGEGTFARLYAQIYDVEFWFENFEAIIEATVLGIENDGQIRKKRAQEKRSKYLKKKNKKRKKR